MKHKRKQQSFINYFVFLILVIFLLSLSVLFGRNHQIFQIIGFALAGIHFIWGVWHHRRQGTLEKEVIIEYLLISLFGAIMIISLI